MAAALVVPLVAVAGLSLAQVNQANEKVERVDSETDLARTALAPGGLVDALVVEQGDLTVSLLGIPRQSTAVMPTKDWAESVEQTDAALVSLRAGVDDGGPVAQALFLPALKGIEANLKAQRTRVDGGLNEPGMGNWDLANELYPAYSESIDALRAVNVQLADAISDTELRAAANTLNDVNSMHYLVSKLMRDVGTSLASSGGAPRDAVTSALTDYRQAYQSLASQTAGSYATAVKRFSENPNYPKIIATAQAYLDDPKGFVLEDFIALNPPVLNRAEAKLGTTQRVANEASASLANRIDDLRQDARDEQSRYQLMALLIFLGAAVIAALIARSVVKPMQSLVRQAEDMASDQLPAAVQGVLQTAPGQDIVLPEVEPVAVQSKDELQTVAAAINHVQTSALGLAVEQATLRRNIADSFVSLGRRTQNLIGLQLELITTLEAEEADPAVLESLYRLDHLATRARRNAESLVVLGSTEARRTGGVPVPMTDVIRATLSEVEAYQRVNITGIDDAMVPGSTAADLIHLLAELVENGLSFSPPSQEVEVVGHKVAAGYQITITDHGVGMTQDRLEQANRRLSDNETFTIAPSRYLGHYVTGKLAVRVGASVVLTTGPDSGVIANVLVPTPALAGVSTANATRPAKPTTEPKADRKSSTDSVKIDGRPPKVEAPTTEREMVSSESAKSGGSTLVRDAGTDGIRAVEHEVTTGGLRKRVPGQHVKSASERSPLLKSAAATTAEKSTLGAETSQEEAQNLASLLTDYTSGIERGKDTSSADTGTTAETEPNQ